VSGKDQKVAALLEGVEGGDHDTHLVGYLRCFNAQQFYEAHDVLEALWLKDRKGPDGDFFKGLIQFAGSFVHLQKRRLRPAGKLFRLCITYLAKYPSPHYALDVDGLIRLAKRWAADTETVEPETDLLVKQRPPRIAFHQAIAAG